MARSHYSYQKRQLELKKKKKREEKILKKQEKNSAPSDDTTEYLAMLRGEPMDETEDEDAETGDDWGDDAS